MAQIIGGRLISTQIKEELKLKTKKLINDKGIIPGLALLLVGENPASKSYVSSKEKSCAELGFKSIVEKLPDDTNEDVVLEFINKWNSDPTIHGILVQLPLPKHIDEAKVIQSSRISPEVRN